LTLFPTQACKIAIVEMLTCPAFPPAFDADLPWAPAATLWAYLAPKPRQGTCITPDRVVECRMGEIVNLRRARKKSERQLAEREAAANRALHGRSKAQRDLEAQREAKARRELESHRIETGDEG
jgi:Domain of unknown function (DUF4169)